MSRIPSSNSTLPVQGTTPAAEPTDQAKPSQFGDYSAKLSLSRILSTLVGELENACHAVLKAAEHASAKLSDAVLATQILYRLDQLPVPQPDGSMKGLGELALEQFERDDRPQKYDKGFRAYIVDRCLPKAVPALREKFYKDHEAEFLSFIGSRGFKINVANKAHGPMRDFVKFYVLAAAEREYSNIDSALEGAARVLRRLDDALKTEGPGRIDEVTRDGALALIMQARPGDILDLTSHDDGSRYIVETSVKEFVKNHHPSRYGYVVHPTWEKY